MPPIPSSTAGPTVPPPQMAPEGAQSAAQEESSAISATPSEVESSLRHQERKAFLNNSGFTAQQQEVIQSMDECLGAARSKLKDSTSIFARDLEVNYSQPSLEAPKHPVSLKVYVSIMPM